MKTALAAVLVLLPTLASAFPANPCDRFLSRADNSYHLCMQESALPPDAANVNLPPRDDGHEILKSQSTLSYNSLAAAFELRFSHSEVSPETVIRLSPDDVVKLFHKKNDDAIYSVFVQCEPSPRAVANAADECKETLHPQF